MKPVILFRQNRDNYKECEFEIAQKYFDVVENRAKIPQGSLVIGRYSVLPFYKELEQDIIDNKSKLINNLKQFEWIEKFKYYEQLKDYTFKTWFNAFELPEDGTQFIVKGVTNSRKSHFDTKMFAPTKRDAILIMTELQQDGLIGQQDIIFREYIPLKTFEISMNNLPITNEFRFFFYKEQLLSFGYYWANAEHPEYGTINEEGISFAKNIAKIASEYNNFFVIDIAEKQSGGWICVELNSGQMSGISMNKPDELYSNLKMSLEKESGKAA